MSTYGWGFALGPIKPKSRKSPAEWAFDTTLKAWTMVQYVNDPFTRIVMDAHRAESRLSRGVGGPSSTTPASTIPSKASNGRASAQAKKSGGPRQSSQRGGRARGKCPKGHYWSYKKKKCVKSKF